MNKENHIKELEEIFETKFPEEPLNSFRYQLHMLIASHFPENPKDSMTVITEMTMTLASLVATFIRPENRDDVLKFLLGLAVKGTSPIEHIKESHVH